MSNITQEVINTVDGIYRELSTSEVCNIGPKESTIYVSDDFNLLYLIHQLKNSSFEVSPPEENVPFCVDFNISHLNKYSQHKFQCRFSFIDGSIEIKML